MSICRIAKQFLLPGVIALTLAPLLAQTSSPTVFASGFNNPRGLKFGPDGNLYVSEGGAGGTTSTRGICPQVPAPVGPYTGRRRLHAAMLWKLGFLSQRSRLQSASAGCRSALREA